MRLFPKLVYAINNLYWRITKPLTLGVRLLLIRDRSVLLVKHTYTNYWYLIGGGVKKHETLEQAARREALEEVGVRLGSLTLCGVYSNFSEGKSDHIILFVCSDFSVSGKTDSEIKEWKFFGLDELPEDISPATKRRIHEYLNNDGKPSVSAW